MRVLARAAFRTIASDAKPIVVELSPCGMNGRWQTICTW
jgi:hypothetical protein